MGAAIPYITRTKSNNGLDSIALLDRNNKLTNPKNVITFGAESVKFFAQPFNFITGNKMYFCQRKDNVKLSIYQCLFLKSVFEYSLQNTGYNYGMGLTGERFSKRYIELPIYKMGCVNWQYMDKYISNIINSINVPKIEKFNNSNLSNLQHKIWKSKKISCLFDYVAKGKYLKKNKRIKNGNNPYITSTKLNNGLSSFIGNKTIFKGNKLTISKVDMTVSYQPYNFYATHDVTVLGHKKLNKYNALFLKVLIEQNKEKANYSNQYQLKKIEDLKLLVPTKDNDEIDWGFMEDYIKSIPNSNLL
ncbi:hypothetical protein DS832_04880 [Bombilactobacillus bombi]|uniref:Type I restriction modification DNA specificity domain-containing protein n=1 Tax=Bombilactobacillus bombi TaxID=1303590 RepID=A0A3R6W6D9_9LACO|nr:hypothetical protein DS832_04880 [Bombilactobacillus bombi]